MQPIGHDRFAGAALLFLVGCSSTPTQRRPLEEDDYSISKLEGYVDGGLAALGSDDGCASAILWALFDEPGAGVHLDTLLNAPENVQCRETVAAARVIRLGRVGAFDLDTELKGTSTTASAVAIRYAASVRSREARERLKQLPTSADAELLRIAARAQAALSGEPPPDEAIAILATTEPIAPLNACDEWQSGLRSQDADTTVRALRALLWDHFHRYAASLDSIGSSSDYARRCKLPADVQDDLLDDDASDLQRGLAAAILLWRRQRPIGPAGSAPAPPFPALAPALCTSDAMCTPPERCLYGRDGNRGLCGLARTPRITRSTVTTTLLYHTPCMTFADCPPTYSCTITGACARRVRR